MNYQRIIIGDKDYQYRVIKEKQILDGKIQRLSDFIANSPEFEASAIQQQRQLIIQREYMNGYSKILGERIA